MLNLLLGPSAVGKTTLMAALTARHGWRAVPVYTTRRPRPTVDNKISVSRGIFTTLESQEQFFAIQAVYGNLYGQLKEDVELACTSCKQWVFDLALSQATPYQHVARLYVIQPESKEQLVSQLVTSGRSNRIEEALADYEWTSQGISELAGVIIIVNKPNKIEETLDLLLSYSKF